MHKRLRIDAASLSPHPITTNATIPGTPPPLGQQAAGSQSVPIPCAARSGQRARVDVTPEDKVKAILQRHGKSFCEELGVDLLHGGPNALWQWLCGFGACQALIEAGATSPAKIQELKQEGCQCLLRENGYDRYEDKTAAFLVDDAKVLMSEYKGDLNNLREAANHIPSLERALLKKFRGVGDGGVDIFFREAQLVWDEVFPFADKKALKAARLVGLREHPQALAALCGNDRAKYVRLVAALVRIELTKTFNEF